MYTQKGRDFRDLKTQINDLVDGSGCMACANTSQETVGKVADILKRFGIDPKDVEAEMLTITDNFAFAEGWTKQSGEGCGIYHNDFFAVCYKLLK